jgi:hypothetical protein
MPSRAKEDRQRSGLAPATKGKDVLLLLLSHLRARILRGKRRPAHPQRRQIERSASARGNCFHRGISEPSRSLASPQFLGLLLRKRRLLKVGGKRNQNGSEWAF